MIAFLCGKVQRRLPDGVILNVAGVGYYLHLTLPAIASLPLPEVELSLWIYTRVREDAIQLYGFSTFAERQIFTLLIEVNGVGPKLAMAILSTMNWESLRDLVEKKQPESLQMVPGIGKRLADKLVLELEARLAKFPASEVGTQPQLPRATSLHEQMEGATKVPTWPLSIQQDLQSALENLGYRDKDISPILQKFRREYRGEELGVLLRQALLQIGQQRNFRQGDAGMKSDILF
jgi:Holliday junction DNA helicase RuvA